MKMVLVLDYDSETIKEEFKMVPVEALTSKDTSQRGFLEFLKALTLEHPISFTIPPTPRVLKFLRGY